MKLNFSDQRILAVVAHPDDIELLCAGTLARARRDESVVAVCVLCRGDKGGDTGQLAELVERRRREVIQAASHLEAETYFGEIDDGTLADVVAHRQVLLRIFRRFRPTLVLAHAPEDYHADHRAAAQLAEAVSWFACSAGHKSEQQPLASPPELWWMDTVNMLGFEPGFYVDISDYVALKREMLQCHASQIERGTASNFDPLDQLMVRQAAARGEQSGVAAAEAFRLALVWKRVHAW
jgi:LmbE family N-acetylglucosaminyl deacetylase